MELNIIEYIRQWRADLTPRQRRELAEKRKMEFAKNIEKLRELCKQK